MLNGIVLNLNKIGSIPNRLMVWSFDFLDNKIDIVNRSFKLLMIFLYSLFAQAYIDFYIFSKNKTNNLLPPRIIIVIAIECQNLFIFKVVNIQ